MFCWVVYAQTAGLMKCYGKCSKSVMLSMVFIEKTQEYLDIYLSNEDLDTGA